MIDHIDHIVLTTRNIDACIDFYTRVLGMELIRFSGNRIAFLFGSQKINVHEYGKEIEPKAHLPVPGSLDICFMTSYSVDKIIEHLEQSKVVILEGPVPRTGACGPIISFYLRDPDLNLVEISQYQCNKLVVT